MKPIMRESFHLVLVLVFLLSVARMDQRQQVTCRSFKFHDNQALADMVPKRIQCVNWNEPKDGVASQQFLAATVVDLFCGAGGLSRGFMNAGFEVLQAIDHWAPAVETYRLNNGSHVSWGEIDATISLPRSTVIARAPVPGILVGRSSERRRRPQFARAGIREDHRGKST